MRTVTTRSRAFFRGCVTNNTEVDMIKKTDIYYSDSKTGDRSLDLYLPDTESFPLFVYFHGGGIVEGDKGRDGRCLANYLVPRGIAVASLNYRMYPSAKYPEFIYDCAEGVAFLKSELGERIEKLFVGGTSAGGYISMMLCFNCEYLARFGLSNSDIDGYIHDAGQPTVHFNVLKERGEDTRRIVIDGAAPLYHIRAAENYPPMLFIWSDNDIPCRAEQLSLTVATLKAFGYDMAEVDRIVRHGTHVHYAIPNGDADEFELSELIYPFIKKHISAE